MLHSDWTKSQVLEIVGRAEASSEHPLGRAIHAYAAQRVDVTKGAEQYQAIPGVC